MNARKRQRGVRVCDGILHASRMSVATCGHGFVFVELRNPDGTVFADGALSPDQAQEFAALMLKTIAAIPPDAGCAGHA